MLECNVALQARGYDVPDYPANPKNAEEEVIKAVYAKVVPLTAPSSKKVGATMAMQRLL